MRDDSNDCPFGPGGGTGNNQMQSLQNSGYGGNPIGDMGVYGASLAGTDSQGGSNLGGQNRAPVGFPTLQSFCLADALRAARTLDPGLRDVDPCKDCPSGGGGTLSQGGGVWAGCMCPCCLNASATNGTPFVPPNPPCLPCALAALLGNLLGI